MLRDCVVWHWDGFIAWGSRAGAAQFRVESHHLKSELLREEEDNPHTHGQLLSEICGFCFCRAPKVVTSPYNLNPKPQTCEPHKPDKSRAITKPAVSTSACLESWNKKQPKGFGLRSSKNRSPIYVRIHTHTYYVLLGPFEQVVSDAY